MKLPTDPRQFKMIIGGQKVDAADNQFIERQSPAHGIVVSKVPAGTAEDVDAAVAAARETFEIGDWRWLAGAERAGMLMNVAECLRDAGEELALLETLESGKPISQARAEVQWTAGLWEYAAALCRHLYGDSCNSLGPNLIAMTLRDPIGVVGMITPWNFPMLIASQKLPFALAAGCTSVIKPSELTSSTTLLLAEMIGAAGVPDGVVNVVTGYGDPVGQRIADHDDIDMISFTGSTKVGKSIVAASAGNLKKVSLELGGKNPLMVFDDADLEAAVDAARLGAYFNMGECCNSSSRILVQEGIADEFTEKLCKYAAELVVGDPLEEDTKIGAIINETQEQKILSAIDAGKNSGAVVRMGGSKLSSNSGRYIETTILDRVTADMSVANEEIFGPVLSVIRFKDAEQAVKIANSTQYGLSAGVFTRDYDTAIGAARELRAGTVWVNSWLDGHSELSFGGYKQSGLGRELGRNAVEEFTEPKTVQLHMGPRTSWW